MNKRMSIVRGFTLVEVLLVLLILALLAGLAIRAMSGTQSSAKIKAAELLLKEVSSSLELYKLNIGNFPSEAEGGLDALLKRPTFDNEDLAAEWAGPYLKTEPMDPWKNPLHYERRDNTGGEPGFLLSSNGPDGLEGTDDDIKIQSGGENTI